MAVDSIQQEDSMVYEVDITKRDNNSRLGYDFVVKDDTNKYILHGRADTKRKAFRKAKKRIKMYEKTLMKPTTFLVITDRDSTHVTQWLNAEHYDGKTYCSYCKETVEFLGFVKVSDSGRRMAQGMCPVCCNKVNRILGRTNE
jgi:hypothetical protein